MTQLQEEELKTPEPVVIESRSHSHSVLDLRPPKLSVTISGPASPSPHSHNPPSPSALNLAAPSSHTLAAPVGIAMSSPRARGKSKGWPRTPGTVALLNSESNSQQEAA